MRPFVSTHLFVRCTANLDMFGQTRRSDTICKATRRYSINIIFMKHQAKPTLNKASTPSRHTTQENTNTGVLVARSEPTFKSHASNIITHIIFIIQCIDSINVCLNMQVTFLLKQYGMVTKTVLTSNIVFDH